MSPQATTPALPSYVRAPELFPTHQQKFGEILGKGAFGSVYRALDWTTGETVAVKQISLGDIPPSELPAIMGEIDLLKNLHHPNIVQYRGFVKTTDFLYIILEYCENGSLHTVTKKFGSFPEPLVALYVLQVLQGLLYLHEEGVIHRDIKASNILLDKFGAVRLADFGVSTRVGCPIDSSVVGSPYWMAPEVVEQTGATSASDVWSLGALVIELITGKPPYHFLEPMPALFRIVNDDNPPLPEFASPVARDFLMQCFQKDPNLRIGARKLLRHPWMLAAKRQADETKRSQLPRWERYESTVQKVQEWNEALKGPEPRPNRHSDLPRRPSADLASALHAPVITAADIEAAVLIVPPRPRSFLSSDEDEGDDNWDGDFEDGISVSKIEALDRESSFEAYEEDEINSKTIRPSNPSSPALRPLYSEDYSDLLGDDDADPFEGKVASLRSHQNAGKRILHPKDISDSFIAASPTSTVNILGRAAVPTPRSDLGQRLPSTPTSHPSNFRELESEEVDDYSDLFGGSVLTADQQSLKLNTRLSGKSWLGDEDSDEDDPFAGVDLSYVNEESLQINLARDQLARQCSLVSDLIEVVTNQTEESLLRDTALDLLETLDDTPAIRAHFVASHGMLAVLEVLQVSRSRDILGIFLRLVNLIVGSDVATLEKVCLVGFCPAMTRFVSSQYSREIRLEAALFIGSMCRSSVLSLQIFVSCRGLGVLVSMLDENYAESKDLVWMAVDGISRVFELQQVQGATPRNDLCRLFVAEGMLDPLSNALLAVCADNDDLAESAKAKLVHIFLLVAQSDRKVKVAMASRTVVRRLVKSLGMLDTGLAAPVLNSLKHLTMAPETLDTLQHANVIEVLVHILSEQAQTKLAAEIVTALFNLCRLSKSRQEETASAGAIPILLRLVEDNSPLKQFALPILLDFAASKTCRHLLWQHEGLSFYLGLLSDPFWSTSALEALLVWLQDDTSLVEERLVEPSALDGLLRVFVRSKTSTFDSMLEPYLRILRTSPSLAVRLASQPSYFKRIVDRLSHGGKAVTRLSLLRITKTSLEALTRRQDRISSLAPLEAIVAQLALDDPSIMVRELAKEVSRELRDVGTRVRKPSLISRVLRRASTNSVPVASPATALKRSGTLLGGGTA